LRALLGDVQLKEKLLLRRRAAAGERVFVTVRRVILECSEGSLSLWERAGVRGAYRLRTTPQPPLRVGLSQRERRFLTGPERRLRRRV
jgi:hypothetical protein